MRFSAIISLILILCSCGRHEQQRVITVTIPAQQWLLEQIVGDRYNVQSLLSPGSNPETFEPSMQQLVGLQKSAAFFKIGMPGFEEAVTKNIADNFPSLPIVDCSVSIEKLTGTHTHEHEHEGHHHHEADEADPHVWTSLRNARIMAANMLKQMQQIDPEGAEVYKANFSKLDAHLKALDDSIAGVLKPHAGQSFAVWHPSLAYFARDYNLKQLSMEMAGKEASAASMRENIDKASAGRPLVFFLQKEYDSRQGATLARELKLPVAEIAVMDADIMAQARKITKSLNNNGASAKTDN